MKVVKLVTPVAVAILLLTISCAEPAETPGIPTPTPTPTPAPAPTPTYIPPPIPEEILASHFGFVGADVDYEGITELGIKWDRPHPGPFIWGRIETEKGKYNWQEPDYLVQQDQSHGLAILATVWPFASWDQANWGAADTSPKIFDWVPKN